MPLLVQRSCRGAVSAEPFVPDDFVPPRELTLPELHLVPLGAQHNESDHAAWTSSIAHIRATPGFESWGWPPLEGMSLEANRDDLERHARDLAERTGFTFTVLRPGTEEVIGCLYIYPARTAVAMRRFAPGFALTSPSWTARCTPRYRAGSSNAGHSSASATPTGPWRDRLGYADRARSSTS